MGFETLRVLSINNYTAEDPPFLRRVGVQVEYSEVFFSNLSIDQLSIRHYLIVTMSLQ